MNNEKDLLLVKLPTTDEYSSQQFYGVGYYSDHGFVFALITPDFFAKSPLRCLPFNADPYKPSGIEILGKVENLPF